MTHPSDKKRDDKAKRTSEKATTNSEGSEDTGEAIAPNPPRTTSFGWLTTPKFGSAGSGGAELEPGPERD